jgi:hypothetical protein
MHLGKESKIVGVSFELLLYDVIYTSLMPDFTCPNTPFTIQCSKTQCSKTSHGHQIIKNTLDEPLPLPYN